MKDTVSKCVKCGKFTGGGTRITLYCVDILDCDIDYIDFCDEHSKPLLEFLEKHLNTKYLKNKKV